MLTFSAAWRALLERNAAPAAAAERLTTMHEGASFGEHARAQLPRQSRFSGVTPAALIRS